MKTTDKAELLGIIDEKKETETGLEEIDFEVLKNIPEGSVISAFCKNCKMYHGVPFDSAEELFLAKKEPLEFEGKYLIFNSCSNCKVDDKTVAILKF